MSHPKVRTQFAAHVEVLQRSMKERGLDVLVAVSPENTTYASGAVIASQKSIPERLAFVVVPSSGAAQMLVCSIEEGIAREQTFIADVHSYVEGPEHPMQALAGVLAKIGVRHGRVGIETHFLTMAYGKAIAAYLDAFELVAADDLFNLARLVKQPHEIEAIAVGAKATQEAVRAALSAFRIGDSELKLHRSLCNELLAHGSSQVVSLTCCAGERTEIMHAHPTDRPILSGDLIKIDIHGSFDGYKSDICRVAYPGTPTAAQVDAFERFWTLHEEVLALPRPGLRVNGLVDAIRDRYRANGFTYAVSHMGHSFGLGLHEHPLLTLEDAEVLEPGTVLSIEPRALAAPGERLHLEDPVVVTASGARTLSAPEDRGFYLGIG